MEPVHRIAPRSPDVATVPPVHLPAIGPEERERKRREREEARERARRRERAAAREHGVEVDDEGHPHVDLTA